MVNNFKCEKCGRNMGDIDEPICHECEAKETDALYEQANRQMDALMRRERVRINANRATLRAYLRGVAVLVFALMPCGSLMGCHSVTSNPNVFHVSGVTGDCERVITGTLGAHTYSLTAERPASALGIACYAPIQADDVSKDFPARLDGGSIVLATVAGSIRYDITNVGEIK